MTGDMQKRKTYIYKERQKGLLISIFIYVAARCIRLFKTLYQCLLFNPVWDFYFCLKSRRKKKGKKKKKSKKKKHASLHDSTERQLL